jgi:hypothetical protein
MEFRIQNGKGTGLLILRSLKRTVGYAGVDKLSQAYLTSWYSNHWEFVFLWDMRETRMNR